MTILGGFARLPITLGGGKSECQRIYEAMRDNRGEHYSKSDSGNENKSLRAMANQIAIASSYQRRGANQAHVELATDSLPGWERRLGVVPDPRDTEPQRRAVLTAISSRSLPPAHDNIARVVSAALEGESVFIVTATKALKSYGPTVIYALGGAILPSGSKLRSGNHYVTVAWETDTEIRRCAGIMIAPLTAGQGLRIAPVPLGTVAGATRVHYYFSVTPDSQDLALVASSNGSAIDIWDYPSDPGPPDLHNLGILVSAATFADRRKVARIHKVLSPMLSAWTEYSIITESPFKLGVSPLGTGAF